MGAAGWVAPSGRSPVPTPIQDLLKHTPADHPDYPLLQDALRISQNFLSSINEDIDPRRTAVTTPKGEVRRAGWHGVVAEPSASPWWCLHLEEPHTARPGGGGGVLNTALGVWVVLWSSLLMAP